jgi:hypothetical protein
MQSDSTGNGIKLGCGGVAGLAIGFSSSFYWFDSQSLSTSIVVGLVTAVIFAVAAMLAGDRFWYALARLLPWT